MEAFVLKIIEAFLFLFSLKVLNNIRFETLLEIQSTLLRNHCFNPFNRCYFVE